MEKKLILSYGRNHVFLWAKDILIAERVGKFTYLTTNQKMRIKVRETFEQIQKQAEGKFIQCHRLYMVNQDYIYRIQYGELIIAASSGEKREVPVGRTFQKKIRSTCLKAVAEDERRYFP